MISPSSVPPLIPENFKMEIEVEFEAPKPMISRMEEINQIKAELELGTMTMEQAIRKLHPDMDDESVTDTLANRALM
jgi:hypothetical protein